MSEIPKLLPANVVASIETNRQFQSICKEWGLSEGYVERCLKEKAVSLIATDLRSLLKAAVNLTHMNVAAEEMGMSGEAHRVLEREVLLERPMNTMLRSDHPLSQTEWRQRAEARSQTSLSLDEEPSDGTLATGDDPWNADPGEPCG